MGQVELSPVDYALFIASLVCVAAIGVYYAFFQRQQTTGQILLGNRNFGVIPVAMTLLASFISAISILGYSAEVYLNGTMFTWYLLTYCIVFPLAAFVYVPVFYGLKLTSAYEYLELRFDRRVRLVASVLFCAQSLFYMAVVLYAPALAISSVMPIPVYASILTTGFLATFYTSIGGAQAVVWSSTIQVLFIAIGLLAVIISGSVQLGGITSVWHLADTGGRIWFDDFRADPRVRHSFWSLIFGGSSTVLTLYASNQMAIQRYLSMPTLRGAQIALLISIPSCFLALILYTLCGLVMYASYAGCDPRLGGSIARYDQLLAYFVADRLRALVGLAGLFLAALYGAGLSTLSGGFNALSAVVLYDFVKPVWAPDERQAVWISRGLTGVFGLTSIGLAFVFTLVKSTVLQIALSIFGMIGGPLLGVFTLGMFVPWANAKGALAAQVVSLMMTTWIVFGAIFTEVAPVKLPLSFDNETCGDANTTWLRAPQNLSSALLADPTIGFNVANATTSAIDALYCLSYQYYSLVAILVALVVGVVVSFATGRADPAMLDRRLFVPQIETLLCCIPKRWRPVFGEGKVSEPVDETKEKLLAPVPQRPKSPVDDAVDSL